MSEQTYYWYEGKKIPITQSERQRAVKLKSPAAEIHEPARSMAMNSIYSDPQSEDLGNGIILFNVVSESASLMNALSTVQSDVVEIPVFSTPKRDETLVGNTELLVKFKKQVSEAEASQILSNYNATVKQRYEWDSNTFLAEVSGEENVVKVANRIYEDQREKVEYAQPNFIRLFKPFFIPNDTFFSRQWALRNTGQTGGISGHDIGCVPAWDTTRGAANITIAILDEGVDYNHEDLNVPGKLVTGYDALTRTNNCNPENNDAHGTACAGIAAGGGNNTLGICGVAPNCRIMGVRIAKGVNGRWQTTDLQIADGINTAAARGADILSNSWGGGSPSSAITNAIRSARNNGRGGRGCVVCFAAGNDDSAVSYPGNLPEVITVAACNEFGERKSKTSRDGETWWGSNFGPEVDVSAPGVHVYTTDISGSNGYSTSHYIDRFNGTSAATPHVAGVAALILSLNANYTAVQVENMLRNSTDDIGTPGFDNFTGFGRINAKKAVDNATAPQWGNPQMVPGWFGSENQGGDVALARINNSARLDLVVYHIDNPQGENHGYYRIGWDLNNQAIPSSWSNVKSIPGWFGAEDQGGGIAVADINGNGRPDLVVFHLDNPGGGRTMDITG